MANISITSVPPKRLAASINAASSSFQLNNIKGWNGVDLTSSDLGTKAYGVFLNPERTLMEIFEYDPSTIASASITMTLRGLKFDGTLATEVTANKLTWIKDQTIVLLGTDAPQVLKQLVDLLANQTIAGVKTFSSSPLVPTPLSSELAAAASVEYANALAFAGAPDSAEAVKGLVESATQTEVDEGDDVGTTTAPTVVRPSKLLETKRKIYYTGTTYGATISSLDPLYVDAADSNKVKKALASGSSTADVVAIAEDAGVANDTGKRVYIPGSLITGLSGLTPNAAVFLSDAGGFSASAGTFRKVVGWALSATTMIFMPSLGPQHLAGANAAATLSNFNELMTLINATDITGAQLETLSDGSEADSLHSHNLALILATGGFAHRRIDEDTAVTENLNGGAHQRTSATTAFGYVANPNSSSGATVSLDLATGLSWSNAVTLIFGLYATSGNITASDGFAGMGALTDTGNIQEDNVLTKRHIALLIQDGAVYASCADGTTQTTPVSLGISVTTAAVYAIVYTPGVSAKFYVNGVLTATLTTNLPTGTTDYGAFRIGIEGDSAQKILEFTEVDIYHKL